MAKSRRKAREAALTALYQLDMTRGSTPAQVIERTLDVVSLSPDLAEYASRIVNTLATERSRIDALLASMIPDYDYDRVATIDRNVMRIAAYELLYEPAIPPAVTINEAVEIAKKYSTAESGKFVNGVLGRFVKESPKADWDRSTAPSEEREEPDDEPVVEVEVETVEADSDEAKQAEKFGWKIRSD